MKSILRNGGITLLAASGMAVVAVMSRFSNQFGVLPTRRLIYAPALAVPAFLLLLWFINRWLLPWYQANPAAVKIKLGVLAQLGMLLAVWLFPPSMPDITQLHHLVISAPGQPGEYSTGILVEIRQFKYLNGAKIPPEAIQATADWQQVDGIYISRGAANSRLEISGPMPVGIAVYLRYQPDGGLVDISWDGKIEEVDLFSRQGTVLPFILGGKAPGNLPFSSALAVIGLYVLYAAGFLFPIWAALVLIQQVAGQRANKTIYLLAFTVLILVAVGLKLLYLQVDEPHAMRDSASYALTSEYPLTSAKFWLGVRPFTVPLLLKALNFTLADHAKIELLRPLARVQTIFSLFSWSMLALALSQTMRRKWFKFAVFGLVLTFSLSMQVGLWDAILLAESLSYSLLALMLTGWVGMLIFLPRIQRGWMRWGWVWVFLTFLVTILYCFGRDSNVYFALIMAFIILAGCLLNRSLASSRKYMLVYAVGVLSIFILHSISLGVGNRWQVFIYDHLAMRILKDPQATAYFASKGLPVSPELLKITEMPGFEYQPLLDQSLQFRPVRDWVTCCGIQTYAQYLGSDPLKTLAEPFIHWKPLVNSSVQGYRNPLYGVLPLPRTLNDLSRFYFNQQGWVVLFFVFLNLIGVFAYLRHPGQTAWLIVIALALTALPMMYFIWFAEPMEVDRHAAQVALQLRLAGWVSIPLLIESLFDFIQHRRIKKPVILQA